MTISGRNQESEDSKKRHAFDVAKFVGDRQYHQKWVAIERCLRGIGYDEAKFSGDSARNLESLQLEHQGVRQIQGNSTKFLVKEGESRGSSEDLYHSWLLMKYHYICMHFEG